MTSRPRPITLPLSRKTHVAGTGTAEDMGSITTNSPSRKFWKALPDSHTIETMARSVTISTPVPTLEEFGKSLGLSKSRQNSLLRLVRRDSKSGRFVVERRRDSSGASKERGTVFRTKK